MQTDPIANMLTVIRNGVSAGHEKVEFPASKIQAAICKVLKDEGFIKSFKIVAKAPNDIKIKVALKEGAIVGLSRVSRPGLRRYNSYDSFARVMSGLGVSIISTSKGVMSSREAKKNKVGGEVLCNIW
ncbi:MAG: 30S ribosomal protein S8 [Alphaproteobacteria bacterium]|nr:MAG: 30S ribosomal protein S8 [Alphaproteobacteria bacterium]